ncbi:MAG: hypothetical protein SNJ68_01505 [Cyanobacteriota bacterium]
MLFPIVKLHLLHLSLPFALPLHAAQLEDRLCQQVSQLLGQPAELLRWSLTAVDGEQVWAEVVATTNCLVDL